MRGCGIRCASFDRAQFGRKSEKLDPDQLSLAMEETYSRQGVDLDRSTLADWVGRAAALLAPLQTCLFEILKASPKLFADETRCPVLDPGRKRVKLGQLWAYARDDRPWGGIDPPAVVYCYAAGRGSEHVKAISPASAASCRSMAMELTRTSQAAGRHRRPSSCPSAGPT